MAENTKIEWANHTFNPWWGCTKVSAGCTNCYADALDRRTGGNHWGPTADRRLVKDWSGPRKWNRRAASKKSAWQRGVETVGGGDEQALIDRGFIKPRRPRVFCASMADVFDDHPSILPEWRDRLWDLIRDTPHLDWLMLTKRPENIRAMLPADWGNGWHNVWLGTSVEDQEAANARIPYLLDVPAAKRFLSCEPLLGEVDISLWLFGREEPCAECPKDIDCECGLMGRHTLEGEAALHWVIVGGESGPKARPMHPDWARDLRDQCNDTGTAFSFKQWGEWAPSIRKTEVFSGRGNFTPDIAWPDGTIAWGRAEDHGGPGLTLHKVGKKEAGRVLDGDTVVIGKQHIRLSGIDAPEKGQTCTKLKVWKTKCGLTSAAILSDLIGRKALSCAVVDIDKYGRSVARCKAGKTDLNREMVVQGWAVAYWTDEFKAEEKQAKAAKRGIWATTFQRPADYRRQKKGG